MLNMRVAGAVYRSLEDIRDALREEKSWAEITKSINKKYKLRVGEQAIKENYEFVERAEEIERRVKQRLKDNRV